MLPPVAGRRRLQAGPRGPCEMCYPKAAHLSRSQPAMAGVCYKRLAQSLAAAGGATPERWTKDTLSWLKQINMTPWLI